MTFDEMAYGEWRTKKIMERIVVVLVLVTLGLALTIAIERSRMAVVRSKARNVSYQVDYWKARYFGASYFPVRTWEEVSRDVQRNPHWVNGGWR